MAEPALQWRATLDSDDGGGLLEGGLLEGGLLGRSLPLPPLVQGVGGGRRVVSGHGAEQLHLLLQLLPQGGLGQHVPRQLVQLSPGGQLPVEGLRGGDLPPSLQGRRRPLAPAPGEGVAEGTLAEASLRAAEGPPGGGRSTSRHHGYHHRGAHQPPLCADALPHYVFVRVSRITRFEGVSMY